MLCWNDNSIATLKWFWPLFCTTWKWSSRPEKREKPLIDVSVSYSLLKALKKTCAREIRPSFAIHSAENYKSKWPSNRLYLKITGQSPHRITFEFTIGVDENLNMLEFWKGDLFFWCALNHRHTPTNAFIMINLKDDSTFMCIYPLFNVDKKWPQCSMAVFKVI